MEICYIRTICSLGLKKHSSCAYALFVVSQVADYFLCHGNSVYLASLDASEAFDHVNHVKLFHKVIDRGLPGNIVKILIDWCGKVSNIVKWNNYF